MENELKTSNEWQILYPEIRVLDPDGWDRKNWDFSWYEELISLEEYEKRRMWSTCMGIVVEKQTFTKDDMIKAAEYGYNFHKTTQFPEHNFEDSCINNTKQWLTTFNKK